jgi:hypothetical protein
MSLVDGNINTLTILGRRAYPCVLALHLPSLDGDLPEHEWLKKIQDDRLLLLSREGVTHMSGADHT